MPEKTYTPPITQLYRSEPIYPDFDDPEAMHQCSIIKISVKKGHFDSEEELYKWCLENYYYPHQITSQYDCTGKSFVSSIDLYPYRYNDSEHTDVEKWIIEQHWGVDI